ncbi:unnamed protein product [Eruca vesicaria subsp. sativa]|uniref:Uncharacterized protein n=1 Tax=Eruca vesicaria subsp. sativa TaxID=29727 RepID=A0ABC8LES9_ERUVS|nr:unnamed protein product [Eruca vesicaria subsp. sativa]
MSNSNLASLPPSMFHKILSKVTTNHIWDFGSARVALPAFNQIGREEYFYKSADLIHFKDWIDEVNAVRTYLLKCYQAGNPQAIYMRGHWGYEKPQIFMSILEKIDSKIGYNCWCSEIILCNRCFWQCAVWDFCNEIHLTVTHWPIED